MNDLALLAQKTIANWSRARFRSRLDAMERSFQLWKNEAASLADGPGTNLGLYQNARENMMLQKQQQQKALGTSENGSVPEQYAVQDRDQYHIAPASVNGNANGSADRDQPELYISKLPEPNVKSTEEIASKPTEDISDIGHTSTPPNGVVTIQKPGVKSEESYHTAPVPMSNKQKIYDISTRLVGDSLELTLVYILRLNLSPVKRPSLDESINENGTTRQDDGSDSVKSLTLVSSFGLPSPEPAFDAVLHMKALRSEEGGLLYQNPRADELRSGERMPQGEEIEYAVSRDVR